jgi:endonuclease/exonuclease/phosphatase family metal-dependent hydrolase
VLAVICALLLATQVAAARAPDPAQATTLKIATWNLEWLIAPATFKPLKTACVPRGAQAFANDRRLPCDVAERLERSSRDFAVLARYARELNADVIALQEVDGADAARLVFPGYEFCFSGSRHLQNTGFAIRTGLPKRCGPDFAALSLDDSLRRGAELVLFPGQPQELHLLSVHLKSGCADKSLASGRKACTTLARQVPALESWIDAQARAQHRFAVLGDFNRELLREHEMWPEISDRDPPDAHLFNVAAGQPFRNCVPGQAHSAFIDHIVLGRTLTGALVPGSFDRVTFSAADARHARLSDHCPLAVRLAIRQNVTAGTP